MVKINSNILVVILLTGLLLISSFVFAPNEIKADGKYKGIIIGKTRWRRVKKILGITCDIEKHPISIHFRNRPSEHRILYRIQYRESGITLNIFGSDLNKSPVSMILFNYPYKQVTDKGIGIGQSKFKDVIEKYGEGYWNAGNRFYSNKLSLSYKGITFRTDKGILPEKLEKTDKTEYLDLPVTEIELNALK